MSAPRIPGWLAGAVAAALLVSLLLHLLAAPADARVSNQGRWLLDGKGRVVTMHGWNMVNKLPPYRPAAIGFGADDARFLDRHGFNTVRLGIIHKALEPEPGRFDRRYLRSVVRMVRILRRHRIKVLLDFHQDMYNERFNGEGEPDWAVVGDAATLPAEPDQGFPANYLIMPAVSRAYDHFLDNAPAPDGVGLQDHYAAAWRLVARRFRHVRGVLGYNLFNEPWPGSQWPSCANPAGCPLPDQRLTAFHRKVVDAIREVDPRTMVFYAPYLLFDFGAQTHHGDLGDERAGFAFNMYCLAFAAETIGLPSDGLGPLQEQGCDEGYRLTLDDAEEQSRATGDGLLLTEFGATEDAATLDAVMGLADERMLSWQQWAYFNEDPCCERPIEGLVRDPSRPPRGDNVKRRKLRLSSRPYPQRTAGTPTSWSFDPESRRFRLVYSTEGPAGARFGRGGPPTRVSIPRLWYRHGYRVRVRGARVVAHRRRVLTLRNRSAAGSVAVTIRPAR